MKAEIVIIRTFKHSKRLVCHDGDTIALFPDINEGEGRCQSYMHVGQHAPAYYDGIMSVTRPATPAEAAPLIRELLSIGYRLIVRTRQPARRHA